MKPTILKTRDGYLDRADAAEFDALRGRLMAGNAPLLIHLHGGLVKESDGEATARRLSGPSGYVVPEEYEQLYIIWRSGLTETLRTNWRELHRRDRLYRSLIGKLLEFFGRKLGLGMSEGLSGFEAIAATRMDIERRLASRDPSAFADLEAQLDRESLDFAVMSDDQIAEELENELLLDPTLIGVAQDISSALSPDAETLGFAGNPDEGREVLQRLDPKVAGQLRNHFHTVGRAEAFGFSILRRLVYYGVKIGRRVWRRFRSGRDHGWRPTIIEEILRELYADYIGSAIWTLIKDDTADHFKGRFGSDLLDLIQQSPTRKIIIVGHSAGAVFACHLLRAWQKRYERDGLDRKADVVFLAPAVRQKLFAETIAEASGRIGLFRMFNMNDERELADSLFGDRFRFLYPASLLYIVSGLFEDDDRKPHVDAPLLGMERFRRWTGGSLSDAEDKAAADVSAFLELKNPSEVYAPNSGIPGLESDARSHGGIDNDQKTLASIRTLF